ncbi:hypothetical protein OG921_05715 [Aldersonia sp. NBC_00410]|uniref:hypothetical protein n=1 Tax=Aldersonia sp. NBC_00410 TaxID=2975954 RepID=UPI0022526170|nr:hypothetical protein [Aldersonia sp. NBC_00410]MCX5042665.1 hypothetical protein [Aldersonia sp. NBC_00410]
MSDNTADQADAEKQPSEPSDQDVEDAKKKMAEIDERYDPGKRHTTIVPGTNGTVTGTAFADLVDESEDDFVGAGHSTGAKTGDGRQDTADEAEQSKARDS